MINPSGQQAVLAGTPIFGGPLLSGQALRLGETVANTFDPSVSGLTRPVGAAVFTRDGTKCWTKTGTGNTAWTAAGNGGFLTTVPSLGPGVDAAPSIAGALALNPAGVQLQAGAIYKLSTKLSMVSNGQRIRGAGLGKVTEVRCDSALTTGTASAYIEVADLYGCTLEDFTMTATTALTSSNPPMVRLTGASTLYQINTQAPTPLSAHTVRNLDMVGCYIGIKIDDTTRGAFNNRIDSCNIQPCNQGYGVWIHSPLGGQFLLSSLTISTLVPVATTPAKAAIRITAAGDVTLDYINNYQCNYGLLLDATGVINSLTIGNSWFDTNDENCLYAVPSTGSVSRVRVTNTWFAGANVQGAGVSANKGHNVYLDTNCVDWRFTNCASYDAGSGVGACFLASGSAAQIRFTECSAGGGHIGFGFGGTVSHSSLKGCDVNNGSLGTITDIGYYINGATTDTSWGMCTVHATTANVGTPTTAWTALLSY